MVFLCLNRPQRSKREFESVLRPIYFVFCKLFLQKRVLHFWKLFNTDWNDHFKTNTVGFLAQFYTYEYREILVAHIIKFCVNAKERL